LDEQLKKRLVGGAVLVSLVVIFVPMLLDEPVDSESGRLDQRIPEPPKGLRQPLETPTILPSPILPVETPPQPERSQDKPVEAKPVAAKPVTTKQPPAERKLGKIARPSPRAWMVQIASFRRRSNAVQLMKRLKKAGLPARVKRAEVAGKPLYRVHLPPQLDQREAQKRVDKINKQFKLKATLIRYPN